MTTIKFNANVCDGKIIVPEVYQDTLQQAECVTVTVITQNTSSSAEGMIDQLMKHPLPVTTFTPMSREEVHERD